ncbi:MAG: ABC transporter permease [Clostridiaceae bacterium]
MSRLNAYEDTVIEPNEKFGKKKSQFKDVLERFLKNKPAIVCLFIIVILVLCAIFAEKLAPYGPDDQDLKRKLLLPCLEFPFGTDDYGRDILSRIIYGARPSIMVAAVSVTFSCLIGTLIGCISGYYGNVTDNALMRFIDIIQAIPSMMLAISIAAMLGSGLGNVMIAVGIGTIPNYARLVRASIMSIKGQEFIEAARSVGAGNIYIIFRHILPNCLAPIIVQATMSVGAAITAAAGLSFIGLGIMPPTPEWGSMLSAGRALIRRYWHVVTFPGLMIMITVFSFNILGDGLRDAMDPRLKK